MGLFVGGLYRYDGHSFVYFRESDGAPGGTVLALPADETGCGSAKAADCTNREPTDEKLI